jgi:hypothetical protein
MPVAQGEICLSCCRCHSTCAQSHSSGEEWPLTGTRHCSGCAPHQRGASSRPVSDHGWIYESSDPTILVALMVA